MHLIQKIGLGTAQWGMPYGIANQQGCPELSELSAMLTTAQHNGINLLDTAQCYGQAEAVLGKLDASKKFKIITKILPTKMDTLSLVDIMHSHAGFLHSLELIQCDSVEGLLLHNPQHLLSAQADALWQMLLDLKQQLRVKKIGISVYHPEQVRKVVALYPLDIVQLPFNIYDQRFAEEGILEELKKLRIEVHARSPFLQGLLLLPPEKLPPYFDSIAHHHASFYAYLNEIEVSPLAFALRFSLQQENIDRVIVGCESLVQLQEICDVVHDRLPSMTHIDSSQLGLSDQLNIVDPSRWVS